MNEKERDALLLSIAGSLTRIEGSLTRILQGSSSITDKLDELAWSSARYPARSNAEQDCG